MRFELLDLRLAIEAHPGTCLPQSRSPGPDQSFLNQSSHRGKQPIGKASFAPLVALAVINSGFLPACTLGFPPEATFPGLQPVHLSTVSPFHTSLGIFVDRFLLFNIPENTNGFIVTESRSAVTLAWKEGLKEGLQRGRRRFRV